MNNNVYTVPEVAQVHGIPPQTLYSAIREHRLHARRSGNTYLIRDADLQAYLQNYRPRVSDDRVQQIRKLHEQGLSQANLAERFNVTPGAISRIVRGDRH